MIERFKDFVLKTAQYLLMFVYGGVVFLVPAAILIWTIKWILIMLGVIA